MLQWAVIDVTTPPVVSLLDGRADRRCQEVEELEVGGAEGAAEDADVELLPVAVAPIMKGPGLAKNPTF